MALEDQNPNDAYRVIVDLLNKNKELEKNSSPLSKQEVRR